MSDESSSLEDERYPVPWVTWSLIGSTAAVYLVQYAAFIHWGDDVIGNALAFSAQAWADQRYWTVLTYAWAHAVSIPGAPGLFWLHIVINMVALFSLGPPLEEYLGPWRFLLLYLGGAMAAALFWFHFHPELGPAVIGASGAVFAVIAAAGTAAPRMRIVVLLFFILPIPMTLGVLALVVCGLELLQNSFGWMPSIAHTAHLGGAAFGCLYVLVMRLVSRRSHLPD